MELRTQRYCAKCGIEYGSFESIKFRKIGELDLGGGRKIDFNGTACCGAKVFCGYDVEYDYDHRPVLEGYERIESMDLTALVGLCCKIKKSPFTIRMYKVRYALDTIYYFDVKAGHHKNALRGLFNDQLEQTNA